MRILVGGGVPLFRRGLVQQLGALGVTVEAEAARVSGVCALLERHGADAVLIDASHEQSPSQSPSPSKVPLPPSLPYAAFVRRIRRLRPGVGVLMLLAPGAAAVRTHGIRAVPVDRFDDAAELVQTLVEVATGAPSPSMITAMDELRAPSGARLTPGEAVVLGLLGRGYSNDGIADALGLSPKTVECHVSRIFDKLGLVRTAIGTNRRVLAAMHWALLAAEPDQVRARIR